MLRELWMKVACVIVLFSPEIVLLVLFVFSLEVHMKGRAMEKLQAELQTKLDEYKVVQKDFHKAVSQRNQLESQLNENTAVKTELDLLKKDAEVYKMIGPVLVKQDLEEAKQNVAKRMDYIRGELKRSDDTIASLDKQQEAHRAALSKLQQQFQQTQMKMAKKP